MAANAQKDISSHAGTYCMLLKLQLVRHGITVFQFRDSH
jgi:hypothetical protein